MTHKRRQQLYSKMFRFMLDNCIDTVPFQIAPLCKKLDVALVPLSSIIKDTGLSMQAVFDIWGNEDGVINRYGGKHRISYNNLVPRGRVRFTVSEELAHMVFGHTENPEFNMFGQNYCQATYDQYEEEGRMGAGMLICHPKFFYSNQNILTPGNLALACDLTIPCATVRYDILNRFKTEITANGVYPFLPTPELKTEFRCAI